MSQEWELQKAVIFNVTGSQHASHAQASPKCLKVFLHARLQTSYDGNLSLQPSARIFGACIYCYRHISWCGV